MAHPQHKPGVVPYPPRTAEQSPPSCAGDLSCILALDLRLLQTGTNPGLMVLSEKIPIDFKNFSPVQSYKCLVQDGGVWGCQR